MRRYSILHAPFLSWYSKPFYRDVGERWGLSAFAYLLILLALSWLPALFAGHRGWSRFMETKAPVLLQEMPSIEISDGAQKVSVLVDSTNKKVVITSKEGDIELSAPQGTVKIACNKLQIESKTTGDITTQSALKIKSNATANLESASAMTVKGSVVKIN